MSWTEGPKRIDIDADWLIKIFTIVPIAVILLAGIGAIWMYFFVMSLLPSGGSTVKIPELIADVRVGRDKNGIPGILAENENDLAMVLGYVMAQDRLWQMDYLRRASQGRLAEILGKDYLNGDHLMRVITAGTNSIDDPNNLEDAERRWLESFVTGVNRYISSHANKLPVEFSLLEYRPESFSVSDVLNMFKALAWESSPAATVDPVMTQIYGRLGSKKALALFPMRDSHSPGYIPSDLKGWDPKGVLFSRQGDRANVLRVPALRGGCAWAVDAARTRSGKPMTASLVYQVLGAPGFWYSARLACPNLHISGAFVPGLPVAITGNNSRVGWSCITVPADDADLYIEILDSDNPTKYWRVDRWKSIESMSQTYRLKGGRRTTRSILLTDTGPIVSDPYKKRALSLRWTGRSGLGFFPALYHVNRAKDGKEVVNAFRSLIAPCMNVVWADDKGGYGIHMVGRIPVRPPESDGILPLPAWTGSLDWLGYIPYDELPALLNPREELVVASDSDPERHDFTLFTGCYWNDRARYRRIRKLLSQSRQHHSGTFSEIQNDVFSPLASKLTPAIVRAVHSTQVTDKVTKKALETLQTWDFRMNRDSAAAAIYGLTYQALLEELFLKPLGKDLFERYTRYPPMALSTIRSIWLDSRRQWLGEVPHDEVLRKSFQKAVRRGKRLMGNDPTEWQWGEIHSTEFYHPLTSRSRFLELLYDVGPLKVSGSGDTIDLASWSKAFPFHVVEGVSLRYLSDMTNPAQVYEVANMGSSAHFFSKHYKDQTSAWLSGRSLHLQILKADKTNSGFGTVLFTSGRQNKLSKRSNQ